MIERERSDSIVGQELGLVEHLFENLDESVLASEGEQLSVGPTRGLDAGNVSSRNVGSVLDEPVHSFLEAGESLDHLGLERERSVERDESDHGSNRDLLRVAGAPGDGVVVEPVLLVPKRHLFVSGGGEGHGVGNVQEVLEELGGNVLVGRVVLGELERNVQHVQTEECHPSGPVGLTQSTTGRQRLGTVERSDVVETQESTLEHVVAVGILSVDPPGKVEEELLEDPLEEVEILASEQLSLDLEHSERRPRVDGRVDVAKVPLVRGQGTVGLHVPLSGHEVELLLRKRRVDHGERDTVEGRVPRSEPGVLPLVGHRQDVVDVHVLPLLVSTMFSLRRRGRLTRITFDPLLLDELVVLLAPQHSTQSLSHDVAQVVADGSTSDPTVKLVRVDPPVLDNLVKQFFVVDGGILLEVLGSELEPDDDTTALAGDLGEMVVRGGLGTGIVWVDKLASTRLVVWSRRSGSSGRRGGGLGRGALSITVLLVLCFLGIDVDYGASRQVGLGSLGRHGKTGLLGRRCGRLLGSMFGNQVIVESVLDVGRPVLAAVESLIVGLVLGEQEVRHDARPVDHDDTSLGGCGGSGTGRTVQVGLAHGRLVDFDHAIGRLMHLGHVLGHLFGPGPGVSEKHLRQDVQVGRIGSSVVSGDPDRDAVDVLFVLGILDKDVPVTILVKRVRVQELVLADLSTPVSGFLLELFVGEFVLGVLVQELHVRVGRRRVEVVVELLDVLSVVG